MGGYDEPGGELDGWGHPEKGVPLSILMSVYFLRFSSID